MSFFNLLRCVVSAQLFSNNATREAGYTKKPPLGTKENPYVITAEGLMGKYNENISETNSKYKGKYVKVSGTVIHQGKFNNSNNIAVCIYRWNFNGKRYDILGAINEKNKEWTRNIKKEALL